MQTTKRILILTTDAGSGHRSAAAAIEREVSHLCETRVVNPAHHPLASTTLAQAEKFYLEMVRDAPEHYDFAHAMTDVPGLDMFLEFTLSSAVRNSLEAILAEYQPDVVVSVYPLFTRIISHILKPAQRPRLMTVVCDLGNVHRAWFNRVDDCVAVPTALVREKARKCGIEAQKIVQTGLPIDAGYRAMRAPKEELRRDLGWDPELPTLLLLSGGAGVGPVLEMAQAVDAHTLPCQIAIVAGRNQDLAAALRAQTWRNPTHVYDFVPLVDLVHATDIVASKAGGLTVSECMAAGKPMVFYGEAPGQEGGNRTYVIAHDAGLWAENARNFVDYSHILLASPALRASMSDAARRIGYPDAAVAVGREVERLLQMGPVMGAGRTKKPSPLVVPLER
jgi:1,2-diacylglycerol 3-beta-galactosyltransferase